MGGLHFEQNNHVTNAIWFYEVSGCDRCPLCYRNNYITEHRLFDFPDESLSVGRNEKFLKYGRHPLRYKHSIDNYLQLYITSSV